ncbi:hypothetical protein ACNYC7_18020 [Morganella morganii]|uniref:hypothetical protein n=1 Tax=Morganella morganii TaxID=582 RepID=UPI0021A8D179|nr:hypothetical protein [Morganella morganii]
MRKLLLLSLMCAFSYNVYAGENNCSAETAAVNAFNNFIFMQERSFNDSLKEMKVHIKSSDDYIDNSAYAKFDDCGGLLILENSEIIRSRIKEHVIVNIFNIRINKQDENWRYNMTFKLSDIDQHGVDNTFMVQRQHGKFLTDRNGKITKSEDTSYATIGDERMKFKAETRFLSDNKGRLSKLDRVSTQPNDSSNTRYFYDDKDRLIRTQSDSTTKEYTYTDDGKESGSTMVQIFSTTETTVTICKDWNKFGRCTRAEQDITVLIENEKDKKDSVYKHHAAIDYEYVY